MRFMAFLGALLFALTMPTTALAVEGVTDHEIRLGASVVLSGPLGPQVADYGAGARLYFDAVNAAGGVHGRRITYTTLDDGFDVKRAVENTRRLLHEDKVFAIFYNTGTAQTAAILPLASEARRIVFGPVSGATALRTHFNRYLFHVRASYADEAMHIARQLQQMAITRTAVFYQDDGLGQALLAEVRTAAASNGIKLHEVRLDPTKPDFAAAASSLAQTRSQAVIMCTAGGNFNRLVQAMRSTDLRTSFYGFSVVSLESVNKDLGPVARGIVLAQIMPSLKNRSTPVVEEYHSLLKGDEGGVPSLARFEGFVHAKLFVEGLRRAGRDLTTDRLIQAFESAGPISFGRFSVKYSPTSHSGSSHVDLAIIDGSGKLLH